jgi:Ser-tRNA(Ala) deacylase AlaX
MGGSPLPRTGGAPDALYHQSLANERYLSMPIDDERLVDVMEEHGAEHVTAAVKERYFLAEMPVSL